MSIFGRVLRGAAASMHAGDGGAPVPGTRSPLNTAVAAATLGVAATADLRPYGQWASSLGGAAAAPATLTEPPSGRTRRDRPDGSGDEMAPPSGRRRTDRSPEELSALNGLALEDPRRDLAGGLAAVAFATPHQQTRKSPSPEPRRGSGRRRESAHRSSRRERNDTERREHRPRSAAGDGRGEPDGASAIYPRRDGSPPRTQGQMAPPSGPPPARRRAVGPASSSGSEDDDPYSGHIGAVPLVNFVRYPPQCEDQSRDLLHHLAAACPIDFLPVQTEAVRFLVHNWPLGRAKQLQLIAGSEGHRIMDCLRSADYPWDPALDHVRAEHDAFWEDDSSGILEPLVTGMITAAQRCLEDERERALAGPLVRRHSPRERPSSRGHGRERADAASADPPPQGVAASPTIAELREIVAQAAQLPAETSDALKQLADGQARLARIEIEDRKRAKVPSSFPGTEEEALSEKARKEEEACRRGLINFMQAHLPVETQKAFLSLDVRAFAELATIESMRRETRAVQSAYGEGVPFCSSYPTEKFAPRWIGRNRGREEMEKLRNARAARPASDFSWALDSACYWLSHALVPELKLSYLAFFSHVLTLFRLHE